MPFIIPPIPSLRERGNPDIARSDTVIQQHEVSSNLMLQMKNPKNRIKQNSILPLFDDLS
jgi:hypothetical protein